MSLPILKTRVFQPQFALWAAFVHLGGLILLPLYFSWSNVALGFGLAALTAYSLGIFHHMYLSHSSFRAHPWLANLGVLLGTLTWRGPMAAPLRYAALHRVHHAYSDQEGDPHSPVHGIFHALLGWNWYFAPVFAQPDQYLRWAGKHAKNPFFRFLDSNVHLLQAALALALFLAGGATGFLSSGTFDFQRAMGWMVYGIFAKTLFVIYLVNLVDVINHGPGYRNYETRDRSTNSFVMAALHWGGAVSWHNNHHARPGYFSVKTKWWEFDMHLVVLRALKSLGLVSEIKTLDDRQTGALPVTHFLEQSPARTTVMVVARLLQFFAPITLYLKVSTLGLPLGLQLTALALLAPLAAIGLHNLALLGHEGTHFNLAKNKMASSLLGTMLASLVPLHFNTGFALSHAAHHVHANTEQDPDLALFGAYRGLWSRLFQARRAATLAYFRGTVAAAFSTGESLHLAGLTARQMKLLARFNLAISALVLGAYAAAAWKLGMVFAGFFAVTYALAYLLSAVRPYLEHAGSDEEKYTKARTFSSRLLDFAFGGINYHLAHHLYPRVPAYRIAAFQKWLEAQDEFQVHAKLTEHGLGELYAAIARLPYGKSLPAKGALYAPRGLVRAREKAISPAR